MTRSPFVKDMLKLARKIEEADEILVEQTGFTETKDKLNFLYEMFDIEVVRDDGVNESETTRDYNDYLAILAHIINEKWR